MKSIKPSLLTLAIAAQFSAFADDAKPKQDMERLVITATGFEQKVTEAPASISIITNEDIKSHSFTSVLDAVQAKMIEDSKNRTYLHYRS